MMAEGRFTTTITIITSTISSTIIVITIKPGSPVFVFTTAGLTMHAVSGIYSYNELAAAAVIFFNVLCSLM